jgi:ATP-dependent Clp protease ATP-binding subunit ClpA
MCDQVTDLLLLGGAGVTVTALMEALAAEIADKEQALYVKE